MNNYIDIVQAFQNSEQVIVELECWINERIDFLMLWESMYNSLDIEFVDETYTLDSWISLGTISIAKENEKYYLNPHILIAFVIDEPIYRINLISSIFTLPSEHIIKLLNDVLT